MDEPKFVNLCAEKQELVFQHLRACIADSNFVAPLFLSELVLQRLKDGACKADLVEECVYLHDSCNAIFEWYFSLSILRLMIRVFQLVDQAHACKALSPLEFFDCDSAVADAQCELLYVQRKSPSRKKNPEQAQKQKNDDEFHRFIEEKLLSPSKEEGRPSENHANHINPKIKKFGAATFHSSDIPRIAYAVALHDYEHEDPHSKRFLSFRAGDLFNIMYSSKKLNGWKIALNTKNVEGLIPGDFVQAVTEEEAKQLFSRQSIDESKASPDVVYLGTDLDESSPMDSDTDFMDEIKPQKKQKSKKTNAKRENGKKHGREVNNKKRALDLTLESPANKQQPIARRSNKKQKVIQIEMSEEELSLKSQSKPNVAPVVNDETMRPLYLPPILTFAKVALSYIDGSTHKEAVRPLVLVFPLTQPMSEMPLGTFYGLIREHASLSPSAVNIRDVADAHFTVWNIQRKQWVKLASLKFATYTMIGKHGAALRVKSF